MTPKPQRHHVHEWFELLDKSGLVLSEPVLHIHFPDGPAPVPHRTARSLLGSWERFQVDPSDTSRQTAWLDAVLFDLLRWPREQFATGADLPDQARAQPDDLDETLAPAGVLQDAEGRILLGLWRAPAAQALDRVERRRGRWRATPHAKAERWQRGASVGLALVTNGREFRLLHVPTGLPAAWLAFEASLWFDEKAVLDGFSTLLAADRFLGPADRRLEQLVAESEEKQALLTDALGLQVRNAVEKLILALDTANQAQGRRLLGPLGEDAIYEAAVYAVMRLVFLLFAEERSLLPHGNVFYDEGYGLGRLLYALEEERRVLPETFQREADAWPRLLALFRLVFQGGRHPDLNLPAYGGDLFDPVGSAAMAVLEHRDLRIPNAAVHEILRALTFGEARVGRERISQRYSYRTLDVEHIGYLYEGLLDHRAARAGVEPMVKLRNGTEEACSLRELESRTGDDLVAYLAEAKVLGGKGKRIQDRLAEPPEDDLVTLAGLSSEVAQRCHPYAGVIQCEEVAEPGHLYLTTAASRRTTATHYTPIQYTRAMVAETLDPLIYQGEHGRLEQPLRLRPPRELLDLKICDPAMGSGAFLVQVIRYLGEKLVDAWWAERDRQSEDVALYLPYAEPGVDRPENVPLPQEREEAELWARRYIAERCVYGVDKNSLAVEMAKLSIWLVTLSRDKPFSFLDHALKEGDSLYGLSSLDQLRTWDLAGKGSEVYITTERVDEATRLRRELRAFAVLSPADVVEKARLHSEAEAELEALRALGDLLFSTVLAETQAKRQRALQARLLAAVVDELEDADALRGRTSDKLGVHRPFHWPLEFPEVFEGGRGGFDAIVGNPPFMGGQKLTGALGKPYREYLVRQLASGRRGSADLAAYFFLRAFGLLGAGGNFGLLATNTIAEGDTRQVGLEPLLRGGAVIYAAHPNEPWPNQAAVLTSRVHIHKGSWQGLHSLQGETVPTVSAFLSGRDEWSPKRLGASAGIAFIGSYVLGMGFTLGEDEALSLIAKDEKYEEVLFPFLNGEDLNSHPEQKASRWVICFWDWPEDRARSFPEAFRIVEERVKPERLTKKDRTARRLWWRLLRPRPELFHAVGRGHSFVKHPPGWDPAREPLPRVLVGSLISKHAVLGWIPNDWIPSHNLNVFASDDSLLLGLLHSSIVRTWIFKHMAKFETRPIFTISDCFETLPLPLVGHASVRTVATEYDRLRTDLMRQHQVGLTELYNRLNDPNEDSTETQRLRELQAKLDLVTAQAYGWDDLSLGLDFYEVAYLTSEDRVRFTVSEDTRHEILGRLSQLNRERFEEEEDQGLGAKKRPRQSRRHRGSSTARSASLGGSPSDAAVHPLHTPQGALFAVERQRNLFEERAEGAEAGDDGQETAPVAQTLAADEAIATRVAAWLGQHPGWHARAAVLAELGISTSEWNQAINSLVTSGIVERRGQKRGTRYRVSSQSSEASGSLT